MGAGGLRSTPARGRGGRARSGNGCGSSSGRTASCAVPTRSSRPPRLSSRGGSTPDCRSDPLHRRAPGALRGRADLPRAAGRPVDLLRRPAAPALGAAGAQRGAEGEAALGPRRALRRLRRAQALAPAAARGRPCRPLHRGAEFYRETRPGGGRDSMNGVSIKPGAVQSSLPPTSIVIGKLICQRHRDARLEYGVLISFPGLRSGPPPQNRSRSCAMIRAGKARGGMARKRTGGGADHRQAAGGGGGGPDAECGCGLGRAAARGR